jgi:hypothetical protein
MTLSYGPAPLVAAVMVAAAAATGANTVAGVAVANTDSVASGSPSVAPMTIDTDAANQHVSVCDGTCQYVAAVASPTFASAVQLFDPPPTAEAAETAALEADVFVLMGVAYHPSAADIMATVVPLMAAAPLVRSVSDNLSADTLLSIERLLTDPPATDERLSQLVNDYCGDTDD